MAYVWGLCPVSCRYRALAANTHTQLRELNVCSGLRDDVVHSAVLCAYMTYAYLRSV